MTDNPWWMASVVGEIGFLIAIPLIVCALIGRVVDSALQSSPLFFLIGILVAIALSAWIVCRKISALLKEVEDDQSKKPTTYKLPPTS